MATEPPPGRSALTPQEATPFTLRHPIEHMHHHPIEHMHHHPTMRATT